MGALLVPQARAPLDGKAVEPYRAMPTWNVAV